MMEEKEIYACAVLLCLGDLYTSYVKKKAAVEEKYSSNPERIARALSRLAYRMPLKENEIDNELAQKTYLKNFLELNACSDLFEVLLWEKELRWERVLELFREIHADTPQEEGKALYQAKINELFSKSMLGKLNVAEGLESFCLSAELLAADKQLNFHVEHHSLLPLRALTVFSENKLYVDLSRLLHCWDAQFSALSHKFVFADLPSSEEVKNQKNLLLNLSSLSFREEVYQHLETFFKDTFPERKYTGSRRVELLFLNYMLAQADAKVNCCVLIGKSFLNRLGADQFYRQHLLASGRLREVISLPEEVFFKGNEGMCLLVIDGGQHKELLFSDGRMAFRKTPQAYRLDVDRLLTLRKSSEILQCSVPVVLLEKQEYRLDPDVYLHNDRVSESVTWSELEALDLRIEHLSQEIKQQMNFTTVSKPKKPKSMSVEERMTKLILRCVPAFGSLAKKELSKLSIRILEEGPAVAELDFTEWLDDVVYAVSDRFGLSVSFDQMDVLVLEIQKEIQKN